jgi:hypothetical protein
MDELTFDQFADFIREFWRLSSGKQITPDTQFERDLDLTGDDGDELLLATERRFEVKLGSEEKGFGKPSILGRMNIFSTLRGGTHFHSALRHSSGARSTPFADSRRASCSRPFGSLGSV